MEIFLKKEIDNNLFSIVYKGIPLWELFRYDIYNLDTNNNFDAILNANKKKKSYLECFKLLKHILIHCPLFYLTKKRKLIIRSSRKYVDADSGFVDPYTVDFEDVSKMYEIGIYESSNQKSNTVGLYPDQSIVDKISRLISKIILLISFKNTNFDNKVKLLYTVFPQIPKDNRLKYKYYNFRISYAIYSFILFWRKPETIYFINYIDKMALIASCKNLGIKTVEIQHGFITQKTLMYHFPYNEKESLLFFPSEYQYLSKYMRYQVDIPLNNNNIVEYSRKFMTNKFNSFKDITQEATSVLFISQPIMFQNFDFIEDFCSLIKEKDKSICVYYKPHPSEYQFIDINYINNLEKRYNFVYLDETADIYYYIAKSSTVVGVYSAALIEALDFGCDIYIVSMDGWQYFSHFIEDDIMKMVSTPKELLNNILTEN